MYEYYEYYYYGDNYCVVGTTYAFDSEYDMEQYMGGKGVEIATPEDVNDDMIVY